MGAVRESEQSHCRSRQCDWNGGEGGRGVGELRLVLTAHDHAPDDDGYVGWSVVVNVPVGPQGIDRNS